MNYKKSACFILMIALIVCALAGCTYRASITINDGRLEAGPTKFSIGTEYILNRKEPYEMNYTDAGVDVTIHFLRKDIE